MNSKTERLLAVTENMMSIALNNSRVTEHVMNSNQEHVKCLKRLEKKINQITNYTVSGNNQSKNG